MEKVEFSVGAKAARLIGRENIADVDGALVELIKNAYDADASCVFVRFNMPFLGIPNRIDIGEFKNILSEADFLSVLNYYNSDENGKLIKKELADDASLALEEILSRYNSIYLADNGSGMSYETVTSSWMQIGTSDKEYNFVSPKGRIKTGAKGIGRFALDKLSKQSTMYTRLSGGEKTVFWSMDWEMFSNAKLIGDVKAEIDETDEMYKNIVYKYFKGYEKKLDEYKWNNGTLIILSPIRSQWSKRLFRKVNTNLRSINPIGNVDMFDVIVRNEYFSDYNFETERVQIASEDYDYRIQISYDGEDHLLIKLRRNEVDLSVSNVCFEAYGETVNKDINDFWQRKPFQKTNYLKNDYDKEISLDYKVEDVLTNDSIDKVKKVGKFSAELYFMRIESSDSYSLMKKVTKSSRKKVLDAFSGIKIYRDSFKVRPYGDEGHLFDWLNLAVRSQKSPAGVGHKAGTWRVEPYQIMGWVSIGRETNPFLTDMANREGLEVNESFQIFSDMLIKGISDFEYDRQYIYREFAKWKKEIEDEIADRHNHDRIIEAARKKRDKENIETDESTTSESGDHFSNDDLLGTVQQLVEESDHSLNEKQILQILSSSGIVLNTFFHEFNAINTQFHVEAPQIRSRVRYILKNQEFTGIPAYNPYVRIDALEKNDKITAAFLDVVMEGLKKENLRLREITLDEAIERIIQPWSIMLGERHITVNYACDTEEKNDAKWKIQLVDLYIIINNFMLNSAWFLEKEQNDDRKIECELKIRKRQFELKLSNNGPTLNPKYKYNPNKIFELGETTKVKMSDEGELSEGTGLGLWILKETVERNSGSVEVIDIENGFALNILINR